MTQQDTTITNKELRSVLAKDEGALAKWARQKADEWYNEDYIHDTSLFLRDHGTADDALPTWDYVFDDGSDPASRGRYVTLPCEFLLWPVWHNMLMRYADGVTWEDGELECFLDDASDDWDHEFEKYVGRCMDDAIEEAIEGPDPERYRDDF